MATFGNTTAESAGSTELVINGLMLAKFTLAETAEVAKLTAYVDGGGSGTGDQVAKAVIYADNAGSPAALKATSAEATVTDGASVAWVDFALAAPLELAAGDYWLGLHTGGNTGTIRWRYAASGGSSYNVGDTYAGGAADPAASPPTRTGSEKYAIYATYGYIRSAAVTFALETGFTIAATVTSGAPTISVPAASANYPIGDLSATALFTHPSAADIRYEWEFDTVNTFDGADYQQIFTGTNCTSGAAQSVTAADLTADTWYCRVRANDGTSDSGWSATTTFYIFEVIRLLAGTVVQKSVLGAANKVYVIVEGSSPLVSGSATYDTVGDPLRYTTSPREAVVLVKGGDASACAALATSQLAFRREERVYLTGLKVALKDGLKLSRANLVAVHHVPSGVTGWYPIRKVSHDFTAAVSTVDVGDYAIGPKTSGDLAVQTALALSQLKKEVAI